MKIVQNTLKIEEKFSDVPKKFRVGPKKIGTVGFLETRHFFFSLMLLPMLIFGTNNYIEHYDMGM